MKPDGPIRVIVFDFDGTLVDSNEIKRRAYDAAFEVVPSVTARIADALRKHPDRDRRFIIESVVAQVRRRDNLTGEQARRLTRRALQTYSRACRQGVRAAPDFPGAAATLRRLARTYRLAVNSGTQQRQLRQLIRDRSWGAVIELIVGSPSTKERNLARVAARFKVTPAQMVLVGDSVLDARAAERFGCAFIFAAHRQSSAPASWLRVRTLSELPRAISRLNG